jgi:hypothetical protein
MPHQEVSCPLTHGSFGKTAKPCKDKLAKAGEADYLKAERGGRGQVGKHTLADIYLLLGDEQIGFLALLDALFNFGQYIFGFSATGSAT